jgi:hypothetical protein
MPTAQQVHEMLMRSDKNYRERAEQREARKSAIGNRYANIGAEGQVGYASGGDWYNYIRDDGSVGRRFVEAGERDAFEKRQQMLRSRLEKGVDPAEARRQTGRAMERRRARLGEVRELQRMSPADRMAAQEARGRQGSGGPAPSQRSGPGSADARRQGGLLSGRSGMQGTAGQRQAPGTMMNTQMRLPKQTGGGYRQPSNAWRSGSPSRGLMRGYNPAAPYM